MELHRPDEGSLIVREDDTLQKRTRGKREKKLDMRGKIFSLTEGKDTEAVRWGVQSEDRAAIKGEQTTAKIAGFIVFSSDFPPYFCPRFVLILGSAAEVLLAVVTMPSFGVS